MDGRPHLSSTPFSGVEAVRKLLERFGEFGERLTHISVSLSHFENSIRRVQEMTGRLTSALMLQVGVPRPLRSDIWNRLAGPSGGGGGGGGGLFSSSGSSEKVFKSHEQLMEEIKARAKLKEELQNASDAKWETRRAEGDKRQAARWKNQDERDDLRHKVRQKQAVENTIIIGRAKALIGGTPDDEAAAVKKILDDIENAPNHMKEAINALPSVTEGIAAATPPGTKKAPASEPGKTTEEAIAAIAAEGEAAQTADIKKDQAAIDSEEVANHGTGQDPSDEEWLEYQRDGGKEAVSSAAPTSPAAPALSTASPAAPAPSADWDKVLTERMATYSKANKERLRAEGHQEIWLAAGEASEEKQAAPAPPAAPSPPSARPAAPSPPSARPAATASPPAPSATPAPPPAPPASPPARPAASPSAPPAVPASPSAPSAAPTAPAAPAPSDAELRYNKEVEIEEKYAVSALKERQAFRKEYLAKRAASGDTSPLSDIFDEAGEVLLAIELEKYHERRRGEFLEERKAASEKQAASTPQPAGTPAAPAPPPATSTASAPPPASPAAPASPSARPASPSTPASPAAPASPPAPPAAPALSAADLEKKEQRRLAAEWRKETEIDEAKDKEREAAKQKARAADEARYDTWARTPRKVSVPDATEIPAAPPPAGTLERLTKYFKRTQERWFGKRKTASEKQAASTSPDAPDPSDASTPPPAGTLERLTKYFKRNQERWFGKRKAASEKQAASTSPAVPDPTSTEISAVSVPQPAGTPAASAPSAASEARAERLAKYAKRNQERWLAERKASEEKQAASTSPATPPLATPDNLPLKVVLEKNLEERAKDKLAETTAKATPPEPTKTLTGVAAGAVTGSTPTAASPPEATGFVKRLNKLNAGLQNFANAVSRITLGLAATGAALIQAASPDAWATLTGSVTLLAGQLGMALMPEIIQLSAFIQALAEAVSGASPAFKGWIAFIIKWGIIGGVFIASLAGLVSIVTSVVTIFTALLTPMGLVIAALSAIALVGFQLYKELNHDGLLEGEAAKEKNLRARVYTGSEQEVLKDPEIQGVIKSSKTKEEAATRLEEMAKATRMKRVHFEPEIPSRVEQANEALKLWGNSIVRVATFGHAKGIWREKEAVVNEDEEIDTAHIKKAERYNVASALISKGGLGVVGAPPKPAQEAKDKRMAGLQQMAYAMQSFKATPQYSSVDEAYKRIQVTALGDDPITREIKKMHMETMVKMLKELQEGNKTFTEWTPYLQNILGGAP